MTSWALGTIYGLRPDVGGILVSVAGTPHFFRELSAPDEHGRRRSVAVLWNALDLRPVAEVPEVLAMLTGRHPSMIRCPLAGLELRKHAHACAYHWTVNGWREYAASAGLDAATPPAPDANDRAGLEKIVRGRGPYPPFIAEVRGFERLFRREYARLTAAR